ncbi:MAG: pyridoxal phosphate enzyme (YggS family) [Bacteroidia bacterium]|jgi:pyridoxal phosphate enzyme (YggS family)
MIDPALINSNIAELSRRIRLAEQENGRDANSVTLMAVSKTRPAQAIRDGVTAGLSQFGENYILEALDKQALLVDLGICWHYIGPIQSNKSRAVATHFDWVHTIDRKKIAQRLSDQRPPELPLLEVCLQVNIDQESQKAGVIAAEIDALAATVAALPRLRLRGLMAIPAPRDNYHEQRQVFARVRHCFETLRQQHPTVDTLSMGMSRDYGAAIAEGATLIRVGTEIFGPRETPPTP